MWSIATQSGAATSLSCDTLLPFVCKYTSELPPTSGPGDPIVSGKCDSGFFEYENYCYYVKVKFKTNLNMCSFLIKSFP